MPASRTGAAGSGGDGADGQIQAWDGRSSPDRRRSGGTAEFERLPGTEKKREEMREEREHGMEEGTEQGRPGLVVDRRWNSSLGTTADELEGQRGA